MISLRLSQVCAQRSNHRERSEAREVVQAIRNASNITENFSIQWGPLFEHILLLSKCGYSKHPPSNNDPLKHYWLNYGAFIELKHHFWGSSTAKEGKARWGALIDRLKCKCTTPLHHGNSVAEKRHFVGGAEGQFWPSAISTSSEGQETCVPSLIKTSQFLFKLSLERTHGQTADRQSPAIQLVPSSWSLSSSGFLVHFDPLFHPGSH